MRTDMWELGVRGSGLGRGPAALAMPPPRAEKARAEARSFGYLVSWHAIPLRAPEPSHVEWQ
jgi:hypothetical protein